MAVSDGARRWTVRKRFVSVFQNSLVGFPRFRQQTPLHRQKKMTRRIFFLNVFAQKIHQRPVTSSNRLGRHYESEGKVRPGNVYSLWWGYDPPGKPEIPIFREIGFCDKNRNLWFSWCVVSPPQEVYVPRADFSSNFTVPTKPV